MAEFRRRFDPATTNNQGPQWLKNLYFIYLVELRALAKVAPYIEKESFFAGVSQRDDEETKTAVVALLNATRFKIVCPEKVKVYSNFFYYYEGNLSIILTKPFCFEVIQMRQKN